MTERRLTRRGRETRERIVAAAAELMFERGVAETTLEDIRAAAGVSGSQVYHYFEDKQALVRAVIDYQTDAVLDTQSPHLDHLDTLPGLRAWRDLLVGHQRRLSAAAAARSAPWEPRWPRSTTRPAWRWPGVRPLGGQDPRGAPGDARPR